MDDLRLLTKESCRQSFYMLKYKGEKMSTLSKLCVALFAFIMHKMV